FATALTACVPDSPTPTPSLTTTTTPTPTPTPSPEPTEEPLTLDDLVVSAEGINDLRIGGNAENLADSTDLIVWDDDYCVRPDGETTEAEPGRWVPNVDAGESFFGDEQAAFFIDATGGTLNRI